MPNATRTLYGRIVLFQERTGFCVDLGPTSVLATGSPGSSEEVLVVSGTEKVVARSFSLSLPVIMSDHIEALRLMARLGCDVRAYLLGMDGAVSHVWNVSGSKLTVRDVDRGPAVWAGAVAELRSNIYAGSIYQDQNLLGGIPFECTRAISIFPESFDGCGSGSGGFYSGGSGITSDLALRSFAEDHYVGLFWSPDTSDVSVDASGAVDFGTGSQIILSMIFPVQGATVRMSGENEVSVFFYDWESTSVGSFTHSTGETEYVVPTNTWRMDVILEPDIESKPVLEITNPGPALVPRPGICIDCKNPNAAATSVPPWFS